jgi:hypothetical protein
MSSHEISARSTLRDLIGGLTSWQEWVDTEDLAIAKSRVSWPDHTAMNFPFIVLVFLGGARVNGMGTDASANFRPSGRIGVMVFDKVANISDFMASDTAFGTKFFGLLDDLVEHAHDTSLIIRQISYDDNPYTMSAFNSSAAKDADSDDIDDEATITERFWTGVFTIETGGY